jgi:hypothetical protein
MLPISSGSGILFPLQELECRASLEGISQRWCPAPAHLWPVHANSAHDAFRDNVTSPGVLSPSFLGLLAISGSETKEILLVGGTFPSYNELKRTNQHMLYLQRQCKI